LATSFNQRLRDWGYVGTMNNLYDSDKLFCLRDVGAPGSSLVTILTNTTGVGELTEGAQVWFSYSNEHKKVCY